MQAQALCLAHSGLATGRNVRPLRLSLVAAFSHQRLRLLSDEITTMASNCNGANWDTEYIFIYILSVYTMAAQRFVRVYAHWTHRVVTRVL